jgi:diaminohydroxyphosphoribosylaminopyrimidine deaminase/5-amino-6-(5-phosphoribosylamino)uracil reductase
MTHRLNSDWMRMALDLAVQGAGGAEPNPLVGCVLVKDGQLLASGYHARYGGPHADAALQQLHEPSAARGATAFVTLEPCSHFGKTPPCADALIAAGVARVVVAMPDPFPQVAGQGITRLQQAGIEVQTGVLESEAEELNAPYLKRLRTGLPWVIAKWAMSLDGKIATHTGESQWISGPESRTEAHQIRGRLDALMIGIGTALADDPLLTARPAGPRVARRIVFDTSGRLPLDSQLVRSVDQAPLVLVTSNDLPDEKEADFRAAGVDVWKWTGDTRLRIEQTLRRLSDEGATNVLVEGGPRLLGQFAASGQIDEIQAYLAPRLLGSANAPGPVGDPGWGTLTDCPTWRLVSQRPLGPDLKLTYRRAPNH